MFRYGDFRGNIIEPDPTEPAAGTEFGDWSDLGFIGEGPPNSPNIEAPSGREDGLSDVIDIVIRPLARTSVTFSW